MEEINEIIARSQTRAQQLLASGALGEDPLKTLTPSRDYLSLTLPSMPVGKFTCVYKLSSPFQLHGDMPVLSDLLG